MRQGCKGHLEAIVKARGLEICGGSRGEAEDKFYSYDLVISLDKCEPRRQPILNLNGGSFISSGMKRIVERWAVRTENLRIIWQDFGVPNLSREFWVELANHLRKKGLDRDRASGKYKVLVHCMGGHGRTGTALSILGYFLDEEKRFRDESLVKKIREIYCGSAVENEAQIRYIEMVTRVEGIKGEGSKHLVSSYSSSNGKKDNWFDRGELKKLNKSIVKTLTKEEKEIKERVDKIHDGIRAELWDGKFCREHKALVCRTCKDREERLRELDRMEREKELEERIKNFLGDGEIKNVN